MLSEIYLAKNLYVACQTKILAAAYLMIKYSGLFHHVVVVVVIVVG